MINISIAFIVILICILLIVYISSENMLKVRYVGTKDQGVIKNGEVYYAERYIGDYHKIYTMKGQEIALIDITESGWEIVDD